MTRGKLSSLWPLEAYEDQCGDVCYYLHQVKSTRNASDFVNPLQYYSQLHCGKTDFFCFLIGCFRIKHFRHCIYEKMCPNY